MIEFALHDTATHRGTRIRARIFCEVWMYTDHGGRIERGDIVARILDGGKVQPYRIEEVLATNPTYQKFRVAKLAQYL